MGREMYLVWQLLAIWLPAALLTILYWRFVKPARVAIGLAVVAGLAFGLPWDWVMIKTAVWTFDPKTIFGVWVAGVPLEEWLFIIGTVWLFCVVTLILYHKFPRL